MLSNLIGITIILGIIQKHRLFDPEKGVLQKVLMYNMKVVRNAAIALLVVIPVLVAMGYYSITA